MGFAQLPALPVRGAADCLAATGAPGELIRWTDTGAEVMRATRGGLSATAEVRLGRLFGCPVAAARPGGAGVLVGGTLSGLRIALREPGAGWAAPISLPVEFALDPAAAISSRGDAVVAWVEIDHRFRTRLRAVRRPAGGSFGAPVTILGWRVRGIPPVPAVGISAGGDALVGYIHTQSEDVLDQQVEVVDAPPGAPFGAPVNLGKSVQALPPRSPSPRTGVPSWRSRVSRNWWPNGRRAARSAPLRP